VEGLRQKQRGAAGLTAIIGVLVALWSASGYVAAFMRASNEVYEIGVLCGDCRSSGEALELGYQFMDGERRTCRGDLSSPFTYRRNVDAVKGHRSLK
jgi:hypothetical protein